MKWCCCVQNTLSYYTALNQLQYKRRIALLEPLIGYAHAMRTFIQGASGVVAAKELDDFLSNVSAGILG